METIRKIEYNQWELVVTSRNSITVTNKGESREYNVVPFEEVEQENNYVYLTLLDGSFISVKFEEDDFLVIDKFSREGNFIESIGSHVFGLI